MYQAGLNQFFKKSRGIDIISDPSFVQANEMFDAIKVYAKCHGKGVKKSTPSIIDVDLERIAEYFCHDHVRKPKPCRLQQNIKSLHHILFLQT